MSVTSRKSIAPISMVSVMAGGIVLLHIGYALMGFSIYRDQHLGTALVYARDGIDLLHPIIVGFNANNAPTPQEFPLWQAAASIPLKWFGEWFGWANIVSLLLFATVCYPVYQLGKNSGSSTTGWWTLALLLCQPLIWIQAGRAGTDGTSIAAAVWFFYCGCKAITAPRRWAWAAAASIAGALAATLKLPFMTASGLALGVVLFLRHGRNVNAWLALGFAGFVAVVVFAAWTQYTDWCISRAEFAYVDLRLSHNPSMVRWYFGDWSYRLDPLNWMKGGWRALNSLFGSFALVALPTVAIGLKYARLQALALLTGAVATTGIFSHLVLHHSNYYLMYSLPLAMIVAPFAERVWDWLRQELRWPKFLVISALIITALLSIIQGLVGMEDVAMDPYRTEVARKIKMHTEDKDRLLIVGGGWGGDYLFLSGRPGLSIWNDDWLADPARLNRLQQMGFSKLVMVNESPLLAAQQTTNPGNESYRRRTYSPSERSFSKGWQTVYSDEDLLIREVPEVKREEVEP